MYRNILLAVDLNEEASWHRALPTASEYCRAFAARLHVITVVPDFGMSIVGQYFPEDYEQKMLAAAGERLAALVAEHVPEGIEVDTIVAHGTVYEEILRASRSIDADLIVMASHRPALKDYLIGPNASRVMRHADRSVLVVRD